WSTGLNLPAWISPLLIIGFFGTFVYHGTKWVDYINRFFMIGLAITYFMIVVFGPSQINT
ncbi:MAG: tyrosine transporter, partial [Chlamydiae bacterium CG10_big_fil_rev_8_21_14_0_10_35_9]